MPKTLAAIGIAIVVESPSLAGALLHLYVDAGWTLVAYFGGLLGTLALAALVARVSYGRARRNLETGLPEVFAVVRTWAA
ncbi:hypothetical protein JT358_17275 [Micrococcales bacterium 31B]|nr:hypothetical protein [Micrococcales bacterium 31B]